jgi:hypothetical protein
MYFMYVICDVSLIAHTLVDASCAISAALGTRQGRAAMILITYNKYLFTYVSKV